MITLWTQGDGVTKSVALLLAMSLFSWIVILIKALDVWTYKSLAQRTEAFWRSPDYSQGLAELGPQERNPFVQLAHTGNEATAHHRHIQTQLHDTLDISDWISHTLRNSIDDRTARFQRGLAVLASPSARPHRLLVCWARSGAFTTR